MQLRRFSKVFGTLAISGATLFSTLVPAPAAFAAVWSCGPVAVQTTAINANASKAAVTADGTAYVFYQDGLSDLKYARRTTSSWAVGTLDGDSTVGGRTTHAVGAGVSAIAGGSYIKVTYVDSTNGDVRQAVRENGVWSYDIAYHATSASTAAGTTALGAGPGVFHTQGLGYGGLYKLTYRVKLASGWAEYFVDTNVYAQASIAAAHVGGRSQVWYEKSDGRGGGVLAHAWSVNGHVTIGVVNRGPWVYDTWSREVLDGDGGTRGRTDSDVVGAYGLSVAALGPSHEYAHVFYSDVTRQELRHAWWNGSEWTFEALDGDRTTNGRTDGETGQAPAVVNLDGVPHVFYSGLNTGLRHAWFAGGQWGYETLDGSTAAAGHCTGYTTQRVFGPTAATVVGSQLYAVSSTNLSYPLLRVAEWR